MKKIIVTLIALLIFTGLFAQEKRNVAVLALEQSGLTESDAAILTDRLRYELFKTGKFTVLERAKMEEILAEQSFQLSGCTSSECMVEIGKLIGVTDIVGGSIGQFGNTYTVNVRLINVETGALTGNAVFDLQGTKDDLLIKGMRQVAMELAGVTLPEKTTAASYSQKPQKTESRRKSLTPKEKVAQEQPVSKPPVKRTTNYRKPERKKKHKIWGFYPFWGKTFTRVESQLYLLGNSYDISFDFEAKNNGFMVEWFPGKYTGFFLGGASAHGEIDPRWSFQNGTVNVEVANVIMGMDLVISRYFTVGLGLLETSITLNDSAYLSEEITESELMYSLGLHMPLTNWLYTDFFVMGASAEKAANVMVMYSLSIHL